MKKILFITNIPNPYRQKFYNLLSQKVDLTVIYEAPLAQDIDFAQIEESRYNAIFLSEGKIQENKINYKIIKYLKKHKDYDDVVVTNYAYATELFAILYLLIHGRHYLFELDSQIKDNRKGRFLKKIVLDYSGKIFSPSRENLINYGIDERKIIQYNFTSVEEKDLISECLCGEDKRRIRNKIGVKEKVVLLYVGRIIYKKGVDILVKEFIKMYEHRTDIGLYLIGNYYDSDFYMSLDIASYSNIHHIAFCEKDVLMEYYSCADIFVFLTRDDPWGLVINEAIAAGLPVLSSDKCGAAKELITDYKNGFVLKNEYDFSVRLQQLIIDEELRIDMSKNNIKLSQDCTIEKMTQRHLEYWEA